MPATQKKGRAANSRGTAKRKVPVPEQLVPFVYKPGQSGNPNGRPKSKELTKLLGQLLQEVDPKDKQKRQFGQILIRELVRRAIKGSDTLLIHVMDRLDGKLAPETEEERKHERPYSVIVMDAPRPPRNVTPVPPAKILPAKKEEDGD